MFLFSRVGYRLFRQSHVAFNTEVPGDSRSSGIRLAAADCDRVLAAGDDRIAVLRHDAQVSVLQLKMNLPTCARIEINALESTESYSRRSIHRREFHVELHDFISRHFS